MIVCHSLNCTLKTNLVKKKIESLKPNKLLLCFSQMFVHPSEEHGGVMRTQTASKTLNPTFHEIFTIPISDKEINQSTLVVQVSVNPFQWTRPACVTVHSQFHHYQIKVRICYSWFWAPKPLLGFCMLSTWNRLPFVEVLFLKKALLVVFISDVLWFAH